MILRYLTVYWLPRLGWVIRHEDMDGNWHEDPWPETWRVGGRKNSWYTIDEVEV